MTPDLLEERLRSALHDATSAQDGAWLDLDPDLVLGRGRRAVTRRRAAAGLGLAAATVAVGLVGWSALGGGAERATTPAGTSSVRATGTVSAELAPTPVVSQESGTVLDDGQRVTVAVDRATGTVRYLQGSGSTRTVLAEGGLPATDRASTWVTPAGVPGLVVGVMPDAATDTATVWTRDVPGSSLTTAPLPGTGFQAFAVWHTGIPRETTMAGFDWTDGEAVYRSDGSRVTSRLDGDLVAFVDEEQGMFGLFGQDSIATKLLRDTGGGERPYLMMGHQRDGANTLVNAVLVVLPAGATDVTPTAAPGATVTASSTLVDGAGDPTLVVVRLEVPTSVPGTGLGSVRWTGADGATSTFAPRL